MALGWTTYRSIPRLHTYAEAKKWHDDIVPIRGDENKTRPCGRRDQKWFSIWETKDAVHVGYGARPVETSSALVTYHKSGSITVNPHHYKGASTNERMSKLLGVTFETYQYDTWVTCHYYDNGKLSFGSFPIVDGGTNLFVRHNDNLVCLNPKYPKTHKVNRDNMAAKMAEFSSFLTYMRGLWKLSDGKPDFTMETRMEAFGMEYCPYRKEEVIASPPNLRWGNDRYEKRDLFFNWARSDDPMDHLRAAITLTGMAGWHGAPLATFKEFLIRHYHRDVLDAVEHRSGNKVKDRLRRLIG